jgi:hypothetical protein
VNHGDFSIKAGDGLRDVSSPKELLECEPFAGPRKRARQSAVYFIFPRAKIFVDIRPFLMLDLVAILEFGICLLLGLIILRA